MSRTTEFIIEEREKELFESNFVSDCGLDSNFFAEEIHCIYHIPQIKKIGVTEDLLHRVTEEQGWKDEEYDVVAVTNNLKYASDVEIALQKYYNYQEDRTSYKNIKNMNKNYIVIIQRADSGNIGINHNLSTLSELENLLKDGIIFELFDGEQISFTPNEVRELIKISNESQYPNGDFFFRVKKLRNLRTELDTPRTVLQTKVDLDECHSNFALQDNYPCTFATMPNNIRNWASERGLYNKGDVKTQFAKLGEEFGELGRAIVKDDKHLFKDSIGDMFVVMVNLAHLNGMSVEDCILASWLEIRDRTGKMENGTFVKN